MGGFSKKLLTSSVGSASKVKTNFNLFFMAGIHGIDDILLEEIAWDKASESWALREQMGLMGCMNME